MSFTRLEFERDVFGNGAPLVHRAAQRSRNRVLPIVAVIALVSGLTALGGAMAARAGFFNSESRGISRMSESFVKGLSEVDANGALAVCAEGDEGAKLIADETRRVFGVDASQAGSSATAQLAALRTLRSELETQGVAWKDVKPFAFGGVRARVESPEMKQALTVLTGEIYFRSAGKTFAIELSAWRCDGRFVIVDVWKAFPMSDSVTNLAAFSAEQAAKLQKESTESGALDVSYLKQVFVEF